MSLTVFGIGVYFIASTLMHGRRTSALFRYHTLNILSVKQKYIWVNSNADYVAGSGKDRSLPVVAKNDDVVKKAKTNGKCDTN